MIESRWRPQFSMIIKNTCRFFGWVMLIICNWLKVMFFLDPAFDWRTHARNAALCTSIALWNILIFNRTLAVRPWRLSLNISPKVADEMHLVKIFFDLSLNLFPTDDRLYFSLNWLMLIMLDIFQINHLWRLLWKVLMINLLELVHFWFFFRRLGYFF